MKLIKINFLTTTAVIPIVIFSILFLPKISFGLNITSPSLSFADVQAAVNQVKSAGSGTVYLPAGISEFWTSSLDMFGGINLIGQGPDKTTIRWNLDNGYGIKINQTSPRIYTAFRISGINFIGTYDPNNLHNNTGNSIRSIITFRSCPNFRIDNCNFEGGRYVIAIGNEIGQPVSTGVIDHCKIFRGDTSFYAPVYGVDIEGREYIDKPLGTSDAVFIEDCILEDMGHPVASFGGAYYVLRHSIIRYSSNPAAFPIDAHGPGFTTFDGQYRGTLGWEIYSNTITGNPNASPLSWRAIAPRAGKGAIFNNDISNFRYAVTFYCDPYTCNNGGLDHINGAYIWGNNLTNVTDGVVLVQSDQCSLNYIHLGSEYFLNQPQNYTPYIYPHPLVSGQLPSSIVPPNNFRFNN